MIQSSLRNEAMAERGRASVPSKVEVDSSQDGEDHGVAPDESVEDVHDECVVLEEDDHEDGRDDGDLGRRRRGIS